MMRVWIHMRIYAQRNWRAPAQPLTDCGKLSEFRFTFDIENVNPKLEGIINLFARFTNTGENTLRRVAAGLDNAVKLTGADDIKSRARLGQCAQNRKVAIGFDGIANRMLD